MGQVHQQAEIVVGGAHISGEPGGQRGGTDQGGLVHVEVKDFQLHVHALFRRVIAQVPGGLEQLGIGLFLGLRRPFARQEGDAPGSEIFRLVNGLQQGGLRLPAALLVDVVGVQFGAEQPGLSAVAHLQMALIQNGLGLRVLRAEAFQLDGVKEVVPGDGLQGLHGVPVGIAHPLDGTHLEIFMDGFGHKMSSFLWLLLWVLRGVRHVKQ